MKFFHRPRHHWIDVAQAEDVTEPALRRRAMSKMDRWLARAENKASTPPGEASSKVCALKDNAQHVCTTTDLRAFPACVPDACPPASRLPPPASSSAPSRSAVQTPAAEQAPRKLDRWLSRAEKNSPVDDGISAVLGDGASLGGLSACCHLIKLLEAHELVKVKDVLVASMRERGLDGELVEAPKLAAPEIPADASAATRKLGEVMTHLAELANEAGRRELAAAKAIKTEEEEAKALQRQEDERKGRNLVANGLAGSAAMGGGGGGDQGGGKLGRWLKRAEQKAAEPKPPEPEGKLGRWLARAERKGDNKTPEAEVDESSSDPLDVALRCCARVRRCWQTSDKAGGGAVFLKEKAKLAADKRALENLMQMVYAVQNTPEQVEGALTPPGGTAPSSFGMPLAAQAGRPPLPPGALNGGVSMGGMTNGAPGGGPVGQSGGAAIGAQPVVARGGTDMSAAREERVKQNDPDELLKQFLADRKKERAQEQANMVEDKKNPKKVEGKGWRAGSPMSSAAKPKEAVRISLTRPPPPPQFQAQVVMLGPPPEGVQQGNSREDVMSKEGGNGFFFYPPGHPNHVASVAQAEGQLRSGVHPQERIAPHWSQASFKVAPAFTCIYVSTCIGSNARDTARRSHMLICFDLHRVSCRRACPQHLLLETSVVGLI